MLYNPRVSIRPFTHTHSYTGGRDSLGVQYFARGHFDTYTAEASAQTDLLIGGRGLWVLILRVVIKRVIQLWVWDNADAQISQKAFWCLCQNSRWQQFKPLIAQIPPLFKTQSILLVRRCDFILHVFFRGFSFKGIFRCKFNPWSNTPWNCVRLPLERSS